MKLTVKDIQHVTGALAEGAEAGDTVVTHLIIDSRTPMMSASGMFCAISGAADGHRYVADMYRRGVRVYLVEKLPAAYEAAMPAATFLIVDSVETAMLRIAALWRSRLEGTTVVGITGSVGKTVVKELLFRALAGRCRVERSPRSWNSRIGVPLSVCGFDRGIDVAIVEVGIDHAGSMDELAAIVRPEIGILTPITAEHDEGFASRAEKIAEKIKLFAGCRRLYYASGDPMVDDIVAGLEGQVQLIPVDGDDDFDRKVVAAVCRDLGYEAAETAQDEYPTNRIDVHEGVNDCVVIYDGFTADEVSLRHSLDFMSRRSTSTRSNTAILADLLRGASDSEQYYASVAADLIAAGVDRVIGIGADIAAHARTFAPMRFETAPSADDFLRDFGPDDFSGETVLLFGSGRPQLERIKAMLEAPRHDTTLEVNLDSVVHNFNYYRSLLRPATGIVGMVKAEAYGMGAVEIAKTLQAQGAAYLAVAVIDEGVELRRGGITMPIVVLNPITGNYKALFDYGLEPSVFSLRELRTLREAAARWNVGRFKVHIKLDTGMHRVGFTPDEVDGLVAELLTLDDVEVASVFSHLATADCLDLDSYTEMQLRLYDEMSSKIVGALPYKVLRHVLNTAGIMRYTDHQYDMVRLGIGLYGVSPLDDDAPLRPVATLRSTIISLRRWPAGTTVGYGCRGVLGRDSVVATVPIGYADGVNRHLGRGNASFVVDGVECPTVGNICMDQCMIDVTDVTDPKIGDAVEVFGTQKPVQQHAATLDTIPYEIIASVAPRVKRIYFRD